MSRLDGPNFEINNPTPAVQYRADDDEEDDDDDQDQDFFTIVPKNEHGHKFIHNNAPPTTEAEAAPSGGATGATGGMSDFVVANDLPSTPQFNFPSIGSNTNLPMSASTRSFFSLLNVTNYIEDGNNNQNQAGDAKGGSSSSGSGITGSSFFNLSNLR